MIVIVFMTDLLLEMQKEKKTGLFIWTEEADEAFYMFKECFLSVLLLQYFNLKKFSQIEMNALDKEVAEILLQSSNKSTGTE